MELTLPKPLDERLSRQDAALHLAFGLFVTEVATLGQGHFLSLGGNGSRP